MNENEGKKDENLTYREMKERNSEYFSIKDKVIKTVFKGIWVDRKLKHEIYENFKI